MCGCVCSLTQLNSLERYIFICKVETRHSRVVFAHKIYIAAVWSVRFGVCHTRCDRSAPLLHLDYVCTICTMYVVVGMVRCMECLLPFAQCVLNRFLLRRLCLLFEKVFFTLTSSLSLSLRRFGFSLFLSSAACRRRRRRRRQHCFLVALAADNLFVDIIFVAFSKCDGSNSGTSFYLCCCY